MTGCTPNPLMTRWLNSPLTESSQTLDMSRWVRQPRSSWRAKVTGWTCERLWVQRKALTSEMLFLRECNAASLRTCPCMIPAENKVLANKSGLMCCHFNCWQIKFWHIWWLRSYTISAESVRRQMDLFPWNRLVVISFHGHINPLEDEVLSRDTPSVLSTANVKH